MRRISHIIAGAALTAIGAAAPAFAGDGGWGGQVRFTASADAGIGQTRLGRDRLYDDDDWVAYGRAKGLSLGANIGVEVGRDWAFQLEAQYLTLNRDGYVSSSGTVSSFEDEGHAFASFLTGQYRIPIQGYLRPYVGAGLGVLTHDFGSDNDDYKWAGKFQLGADFAVAQTVSIYGQYDVIAIEGKFDQTNSLLHVGRFGVKKRF